MRAKTEEIRDLFNLSDTEKVIQSEGFILDIEIV